MAALDEDLSDRAANTSTSTATGSSYGPATGLLSVEQRVALHRIHGAGVDLDGDVELARGIYPIAHCRATVDRQCCDAGK